MRSDVVHGLGQSELLTQDCSMYRQILIDLLNTSILTALTPPEYSQDQSIRSIMAGDYELRPCSRASIRFSEGQTCPYLGEWVEHQLLRKSERRTGGRSKADPVVNINSDWAIKNSQRESVESASYVEFKRLGQKEYPLRGQTIPEFIPWNDRRRASEWVGEK